MLYLGEDKINDLLFSRGMTLSGLARDCGVSRQSLYDMFSKKPVFNSTFVKILNHLGVDYDQITESRDNALLRTMPMRVQKAVMCLIQFCDAHNAGLILFGSRARGKGGIGPDWDFGVYSQKPFDQRSFSVLKQKLMDEVFPNRIDIVNLNAAPGWFLESVAGDHIQVHGKYLLAQFVERKAA